MKILTIMFLMSFKAAANHYIKVSEIEACKQGAPISLYSPKQLCEGECLEWPEGAFCSSVEIADVEIDDPSRPIMSKTDVEACDSQESCQELLSAKECPAYINEDYTEVYCSELIGYHKKTEKQLVVNPVKLQAMKDKEAAQKAIADKIALGQRARSACQSVLDLISGYNINRELSAEQVTAMQMGFADIEKALQSNRPSSAKALISEVAVDGVIVTQEMKDIALELLKDF